MAEDDFHLRVEFLSAGGSRPLDQITKKVYEQVERERADLTPPRQAIRSNPLRSKRSCPSGAWWSR